MSIANEVKNVLKFCYRGALSQIVYGTSCGYHDILAMVIDHYSIPAEFSDCLQISNLNGYVFEKQVFQYFILLFPNPEIVFYVRPGYKSYKWSNKKSSVDKNAGQPLNKSSVNNNNNLQKAIDKLYGAPVQRQNCFLGSLPVTSKSGRKQHNEVKVKRLIAKRQRLNEAKSAVHTPVRVQKRSIRV